MRDVGRWMMLWRVMASSDYHHPRESLDPLAHDALYSSCDRPWDTLRSETAVVVCLERVTRPVAVDPDEKLAAEAARRNWPVISLRAGGPGALPRSG